MHSKESVDNSMSSGMGNETKKLGTEIDVLKKRIEYWRRLHQNTPTISIHSSRAELMSIARDQESRIPKPERQDITHNVGTIGKMVYAQNARESR